MLALNIPDELTLDHVWRDKKREYSFDAVFSPDASQDKARLLSSQALCALLLILQHKPLMPSPIVSAEEGSVSMHAEGRHPE